MSGIRALPRERPTVAAALPVGGESDYSVIKRMASEAYDSADGNVSKAVEAMEDAAFARGEIADRLLMALVRAGCRRAVSEVHVGGRSKIWNAPAHVAKDADESDKGRVVALAAGNLMLFPLPGGKRLGDAKRSDVAFAADVFEVQADDMKIKARWLRLIAGSLRNHDTVAETLTEEELNAFRTEARNAQ